MTSTSFRSASRLSVMTALLAVAVGGCNLAGPVPSPGTPAFDLYVTQREPEVQAATAITTGGVLLGIEQPKRAEVAKLIAEIAQGIKTAMTTGELANEQLESRVFQLVQSVEPKYRDQVAFAFVSASDLIKTQLRPLDTIDKASREAAVRRLLIAAANGVVQGTRTYVVVTTRPTTQATVN